MTPLEISADNVIYPAILREIHQPPTTLWVEGDVSVLSHPLCVAIVGARQCSPYGEKAAFELARDLATAGAIVVSGLAYGIDTAAHRGALEGGGKTIAVLGSGIDSTYPVDNTDLRKKISQNGAVISELGPGAPGSKWSFPRRNRIISGLSRGVVVVEAGLKSGSLITVEWALQQGREIFAVPGSIDSPLSEGTHALIKKGAKLATNAQDVLEEFPNFSQPLLQNKKIFASLGSGESGEPKINPSSDEGRVLSLLSSGPRAMDELIDLSGYPIEKMSSLLVALEIDGKIKSLPGSRFERR